MPCISRFQPSFSSGTMCAVGRWEGLVVVNSNLIWPLWSTTLVHILWLWWFWGACENLPRHVRSFLASIFTNYLALIFYRLRGKGHVEVGENGQTSEGVELWRATEFASLDTLVGGVSFKWLKTYGKLSFFTFLTLYQHLGPKGANSVFYEWFLQINWIKPSVGITEYSKCMGSCVTCDITLPQTVWMVCLCWHKQLFFLGKYM